MDNGWDSRRPLLGCPFGPPSGVHSPAVPCSDPTTRNSLKGCLNWVLLSVIGLLCCFDVLYYSADFSDVKPRFSGFSGRFPFKSRFWAPVGRKWGRFLCTPAKAAGISSAKYRQIPQNQKNYRRSNFHPRFPRQLQIVVLSSI